MSSGQLVNQHLEARHTFHPGRRKQVLNQLENADDVPLLWLTEFHYHQFVILLFSRKSSVFLRRFWHICTKIEFFAVFLAYPIDISKKCWYYINIKLIAKS